jgi:alpha-beta hydrolase superfamily lysophospholipase
VNDLYESMERLRGNKPYTKGKEASEKVKLPILMAHGNGDKVTCFKTSKEFFDKVPSTDKTFQEWDTLYHERKWNLCLSFLSFIRLFSDFSNLT